MRKLAGAIAAMTVLGGGVPAAAQAGSDKPLTTLSIAEVRALGVETGGAPGEVEHLENNEYRIQIDYPDGLPVHFEGWSCTGAGEAKRCAEFMMYVWFAFDSEAEARAKAHEISIVYLSDTAIGPDVKVWRMDYLAGLTRDRMLGTFRTFLETVGVARDVAYPPKGGTTGGK